ncbi:BMP family ABC transporter substrate-binding protein [Gemmiger sp. An87]|uniref:BMP family protein n=1 Tax=Allofournierella massiliensis TaxID=1650663 RepID=A0ABT7USD7_9FIRM|nr:MULTISPECIES: BMP family protein [Fournierella]MDM8201810.1 BMP family protein [Fournierella massiliensis]OUN15857.1 BMP family ABC transporter substrate-binding protein [Gemmiger sp. An87]
MKKVLALIMAGAMALSLVACGGGGSGEGGSTDDGSLRVGLIASSMGTQSFNDDVWAGLENAEAELGISAEYIEVSEVSDAANSLRTLIAQGDTLLVVPSSEFHDAMMEVAAEYPDCDFMYLAGEETGAENVMSVEYKENEAAFLGGALAASLSQTGKIGTVLAVQEPLQLRYQYGYMAGAKTVNPDCEVSVLFTNSYTDTNLGQESAKALYDKGADYVSCFAGACNLGVFNAAKEAGDGKYCLGAATGQFDKMPDKIVASVVKSIDVALYDMIKDYKDNGTFNGGGCTVLGLKEGGVELRYTTMNDELLNSIPEDVKASIEDLQNKIINGEITVPGTEEEYNTYIASLG